jgi:hypothetical protein
VFCRKTSFVREHFVHFVGIIKEEFDGRNPPWRIHEVSEAVKSCKGARKLWWVFFLRSSSWENRVIRSESTGVVRSLTYLHLGVSWVEESKPLHQDSRDRERRSPEIAKESESSDWKDTCHKILSIGDSNIRVQKRKSFDFASGEVVKRIRTVHMRVDRWRACQHGGQTFIDHFGVS